MRCERVLPLLQEHADDLLLPLDRAAVEEHLETCPTCVAEREGLVSLCEALDLLPEDEVSDGFATRVMESLPEMLPAKEGAAHVARWGVAAAAALVVFTLALIALPALGGPAVASETLQPLSASLRLGGALLSTASAATASALDASASVLLSAGLGPKVLFAIAFLACNLALAVSVHRYRERLLPQPGARVVGHG